MATRPEHVFCETAKQGLTWILSQQRADGSFSAPQEGIAGYYKVPYALTVTGHLRAAQRLLNWSAKHHFTPAGNFHSANAKTRTCMEDFWPVYGKAWLVLGAHRTGRWDLSFQGAAHLLRYQVPVGGFYAIEDGTRFLEPVSTSWGGLATLTTGNLPAACQAGDLLVHLVNIQPETDRFYYRLDLNGNLMTTVPAGSELFYYVDAAHNQQIYFHPGISLIFLAQLYRATNESRYLEACQTLFQFTARCAEDIYRFPPSGKLGMGCALLHALTGQDEAKQAAVSVGTYLVETQASEGFWKLPDVEAYQTIPDKHQFKIVLDVTAEFCIFLTEIAALI